MVHPVIAAALNVDFPENEAARAAIACCVLSQKTPDSLKALIYKIVRTLFQFVLFFFGRSQWQIAVTHLVALESTRYASRNDKSWTLSTPAELKARSKLIYHTAVCALHEMATLEDSGDLSRLPKEIAQSCRKSSSLASIETAIRKRNDEHNWRIHAVLDLAQKSHSIDTADDCFNNIHSQTATSSGKADHLEELSKDSPYAIQLVKQTIAETAPAQALALVHKKDNLATIEAIEPVVLNFLKLKTHAKLQVPESALTEMANKIALQAYAEKMLKTASAKILAELTTTRKLFSDHLTPRETILTSLKTALTYVQMPPEWVAEQGDKLCLEYAKKSFLSKMPTRSVKKTGEVDTVQAWDATLQKEWLLGHLKEYCPRKTKDDLENLGLMRDLLFLENQENLKTVNTI